MESLFVKKLDTGIHNLRIIKDASFLGDLLKGSSKIYKDDAIWFGLVQGFEEEWGYFSQAEIESLKPRTWEIKKVDLPYAGRR